ncbi:helix-turn-helix transcriptional regulator [Clostridium celatum]|uniref:helix-turn-helix transcriptional regulator n=1 Tax=Clostridium celatum TaxID=36834 RepID=UPI00189BC41F|nr:helix-turn-helix transcriptional regulator [Clostridium celatum]MDU3723537.1 helix-turn-helix transcriptional regulator [Clostridium celatum]
MSIEDLKVLRIRRKLKQKDIASELGITTNSYTKKENGINPFTLKEVKILKEFLKITDNEIIKIFL